MNEIISDCCLTNGDLLIFVEKPMRTRLQIATDDVDA